MGYPANVFTDLDFCFIQCRVILDIIRSNNNHLRTNILFQELYLLCSVLPGQLRYARLIGPTPNDKPCYAGALSTQR